MGKSKFDIIPKSDLKEYGNKIMLKEISYKMLLSHLSVKYKELENLSVEALRKFMITRKYVLNKQSFEKINLNIQKTKLSEKKRLLTVKNIKKELLNNNELQKYLLNDNKFLEKLFTSNVAKKFIITYIIEIIKNKKKDLD